MAYADESNKKAPRYDLLEMGFIASMANRMLRGIEKGRSERDYLNGKDRSAYVKVKINHAMEHIVRYMHRGELYNLAAAAANLMIAHTLALLLGSTHPYRAGADMPHGEMEGMCECGHSERFHHINGFKSCGYKNNAGLECPCIKYKPVR